MRAAIGIQIFHRTPAMLPYSSHTAVQKRHFALQKRQIACLFQIAVYRHRDPDLAVRIVPLIQRHPRPRCMSIRVLMLQRFYNLVPRRVRIEAGIPPRILQRVPIAARCAAAHLRTKDNLLLCPGVEQIVDPLIRCFDPHRLRAFFLFLQQPAETIFHRPCREQAGAHFLCVCLLFKGTDQQLHRLLFTGGKRKGQLHCPGQPFTAAERVGTMSVFQRFRPCKAPVGAQYRPQAGIKALKRTACRQKPVIPFMQPFVRRIPRIQNRLFRIRFGVQIAEVIAFGHISLQRPLHQREKLNPARAFAPILQRNRPNLTRILRVHKHPRAAGNLIPLRLIHGIAQPHGTPVAVQRRVGGIACHVPQHAVFRVPQIEIPVAVMDQLDTSARIDVCGGYRRFVAIQAMSCRHMVERRQKSLVPRIVQQRPRGVKILQYIFPSPVLKSARQFRHTLSSLYYRVVVIRVPLQGLVLHCRGCCGSVSSSYRQTVPERLQPQPFTVLLIS